MEELKKMSQTLEGFRRGTAKAVFVEAGLAFHSATFDAARNPVCTERRNPVEAREAMAAHQSGAKFLLSRTWPM